MRSASLRDGDLRFRRFTRAALMVVGAILVVSMALAVASWGTAWRIPAASPEGAGYKLAASWDGSDVPSGKFEGPIGVAVGTDGDAFVTDARNRVVRLSAEGAFRNEWGGTGDGPGKFSNPVGVAVAPDGSVYVSDYFQDRLQKFAPDGRFLLEFGSPGSGPGEFDAPAGLATDNSGSLYVADFYNDRVQQFDADGGLRRIIGHAGRLGAGALHYPTGLDVVGGQVIVADAYNYQLQWFRGDATPLRRLGYHLFWLWPTRVSSPAGFNVPTDVAVSRSGVVHVADSGNHRVVMLSEIGERLGHWEIPDPNPDIYSPEQVAVSPDGNTVYATDLGRNRVLVLEVSGR